MLSNKLHTSYFVSLRPTQGGGKKIKTKIKYAAFKAYIWGIQYQSTFTIRPRGSLKTICLASHLRQSLIDSRYTLKHTHLFHIACLPFSCFPLLFILLFTLKCTCTHPRNCNEDSISTMESGKHTSPHTITVEVLILAKRRCKWRKV